MYNNKKYHYSKHEPLIPSYISEQIITLRGGRQLFIDNYLFDNLVNCEIKYYSAEKYFNNPVLSPNSSEKRWAAPTMDSIIWDPYSKHFKMWYSSALQTKLAISDNGIDWFKPYIINKQEQSILPCCSKCKVNYKKYKGNNNFLVTLGGCQNGKGRGSVTQILDRKEKNRNNIFKMIFGHCHNLNICISKDGINWELSKEKSGWGGGSPWYLCYNPFKKKYVYTFRDNLPHINLTRVNRFKEITNLTDKWCKWNKQMSYGGAGFRDIKEEDPQITIVADKYDKSITSRIPGIYCASMVAYESISLFFMTVYQGQHDNKNKSCELYIGYSRDGIQYSRQTVNRKPFINESKASIGKKKESYVIMCGGNILIVDEKIYLYIFNYDQILKENNTYLYTIRRDGFASISSINDKESIILTKTLIINGEYLFVNYDNHDVGYLYIELLDENNNILQNYSKEDCDIIKTDSTKIKVKWKKKGKINSEDIKNLKIKFYFIGSLYSFWFSNDETGESNGFIGNGGPDYDYYSDSKKTDKLNITRFSNIEITIKKNDEFEKIIYCLHDCATKINKFKKRVDECGIILNYKNINDTDISLDIDLKYKFKIMDVKLIL